MLFDVRNYRCKPGWLKDHLAMYAEYGKEVQYKHLGAPVFYGLVESGEVNGYTHIWAYHNAGDRETKRTALFADPVWLNYMAKSRELGALIQQDNQLMIDAPFFDCPVKPI